MISPSGIPGFRDEMNAKSKRKIFFPKSRSIQDGSRDVMTTRVHSKPASIRAERSHLATNITARERAGLLRAIAVRPVRVVFRKDERTTKKKTRKSQR